jgi:predicted  nucleic acid-binding Zn ribbon protein
MIVAQISFGLCPNHLDREQFEDLVESYMAALLRNWQILHDYILTWQDGKLSSFSCVSRRDALNPAFLSGFGRAALAALAEANCVPKWQLLDNESFEELDAWDKTTTFVLFTHHLFKNSPLICLNSHAPIALYKVPISDLIRDRIYVWVHKYQNSDGLWISSGDLEASAYQQLSDPRSGLSAEGRELCNSIEETTGISTYLYLYLASNDSQEIAQTVAVSDDQVCPGCSNAWDRPRAGFFGLQCGSCRLVTNARSN